MSETVEQVEFFSPEVRANPHPFYARLQASEPVHYVHFTGGQGFWLVTRYEDVTAILKDPRFIKNWYQFLTPQQVAAESQLVRILNRHMLNMDPPDHTRIRGLVHKAFTPKLMESMRDRVQKLADELLDAVQDKGEMDLIDDYAFPLPIVVIAEMLGAPSQDRDKFRLWSDTFISPANSPEEWDQALELMTEFVAYLGAMFDERRKHPKDDLITALVQAEEAGDRLNEEELFGMVILLLVAGHETTVNLIGNGMLALLQHPDQFEKLKNKPSLIKDAVEELLRYNGPVETSTGRWAVEDVEIGGKHIRRGDQVIVALTAANRDASIFESPTVLDISRADNKHIAFGQGIHYCLGAPLARVEGQVGISTLIRRMPNLKLKVTPEELQWRPSTLLRGLHRLPVTF